MKSSARKILRWLSVPIATLLAMVVSAIFLVYVVEVLSRFAIVRDSADVVAGVHGGLVAWATLATARTVAPTRRRRVVLFALLCGVWAAWRVLGDWYFPEHHPRAYQPSNVPLIMTLVSGLVCAAVLWRGAVSHDRIPRRGSRVLSGAEH